MSIVMLRKKLGKGMKTIMMAVAVTFVVSCFVGYGGYRMGQQGGKQPQPIVATVNKRKITREDFNEALRGVIMQYQRYGGAKIMTAEMLKQNTLDMLVDRILKTQAARAERIRFGRREREAKIEELVDQQIMMARMQARSPRDFDRMVKRRFESLDKLKETLRKDILSGVSSEELDRQIVAEKLQKKVESQVNTDEQALKESYDEVRARHILIRIGKGADAERKAQEKASKILAQVKQGMDFATLAQKKSQDPGSAIKGGDLGFFPRGIMDKEFERVAYSLKPGHTSDLVKTQFGFHIIKVEEKRSNIPKDFEKKKKQLLDDFKRRKEQEAWRDYEQNLKRNAVVVVLDPELKAYKAQMEGKKDEAVALYKKALEYAGVDTLVEPGPIYYNLGTLYEQMNKPRDAAFAYRETLKSEESADVHIALGKLLQKQKKVKEALDQYKQASELSYDQPYNHGELERLYREMGKSELANREKKLMDQAMKEAEKNRARP